MARGWHPEIRNAQRAAAAAVRQDARYPLIPEQPKALVDALTTWIKRLQ
jgi:hypothetical protein